ncbi:MAG: electron transfer flavoprotein subunit alpha/FixB family protein, partial [Gammaproteobacteria bacterium]|nr:electron transfer flavoprotein subunit alpha/FixB family protein [Gammaproteobacteria bacterium]
MAVLVIAEHNHLEIKPATLNTIAAGLALDSAVTVLVAGHECAAAADAAAKALGVTRVLKCDAPRYAHHLAEDLAALVAGLADAYEHILAPATTFGKNFLPRVGALLDVAPISDITAVQSPDTFVRPIYAGNAMATVRSADTRKVITVRTTAFDAVAADGGAATVESIVPPGKAQSLSQ